ncbi:MAG: endolytic transglycosylase MltG [Paracoccaceae bacterium]
MWRHIASNAVTFLVVLLFLGAGVILWGQSEYNARGPLEQAICVEVERGANMRTLSRGLEARGAVSNAMILRLGAEYTEKSDQLKFGSYIVPAHASMSEVVDILTRGGASSCGTELVYRIGVTRTRVELREVDPATARYEATAEYVLDEAEPPAEIQAARADEGTRFRVALAEGVTSWQVVEGLRGVAVLEGEIDGIPAEGSLAPDSYEISRGSTRAALIERMQQAQQVILAAAWEDRAEDLPLETPEEALVLASIIEKETALAEERPQVASVFVNRLERGMRLQTDPTVIYGVTEGRGALGRGLRQSELRSANAWNTYVIEGLPPTPIANPGRASIEAALNPAETGYVFFVARSLDPRDGHVFAETLDEHNRNVAAYRALERAAE